MISIAINRAIKDNGPGHFAANFLREQEEKIRELISGAARATEVFTEDELEDFARMDYPQTLKKP